MGKVIVICVVTSHKQSAGVGLWRVMPVISNTEFNKFSPKEEEETKAHHLSFVYGSCRTAAFYCWNDLVWVRERDVTQPYFQMFCILSHSPHSNIDDNNQLLLVKHFFRRCCCCCCVWFGSVVRPHFICSIRVAFAMAMMSTAPTRNNE